MTLVFGIGRYVLRTVKHHACYVQDSCNVDTNCLQLLPFKTSDWNENTQKVGFGYVSIMTLFKLFYVPIKILLAGTTAHSG